MTQLTPQQRERPKSEAAESDFPDPSDICDFGYVLTDKPKTDKSPPELRIVAR